MTGAPFGGAPTRAAAGAILALAFAAAWMFAPAGGLETIPATVPFAAPGIDHPLGTDDLGRDMLLAVAQGARTSLTIGAAVTAIALGTGFVVGLAAGTGGRWRDEGLMRFADIVASLPAILIAILVAALFGGSITHLALVLGFTRWPLIARLVRVETASLRGRDFVRAAEALGVPPLRIAVRHLLPHAATAAVAGSGVLFGGAMVSEAALAFVGLGDPSVTSLGQIAAAGFVFIGHAPWMWVAPVAVISVAAGLLAISLDRAGDPG